MEDPSLSSIDSSVSDVGALRRLGFELDFFPFFFFLRFLERLDSSESSDDIESSDQTLFDTVLDSACIPFGSSRERFLFPSFLLALFEFRDVFFAVASLVSALHIRFEEDEDADDFLRLPLVAFP